MKSTAKDGSAADERYDERVSATVVLGRKERWCALCGESMSNGETCPRCDGRVSIDPAQILSPGEYLVL